MTREPDPYAAVVQGLRADGVHVDPLMREYVTPAQERAMEVHVEQSVTPLFVVVVPLQYDSAYGSDAENVLTILNDDLGEPGSYVMNDSGYDYDDPYVSVEVKDFGMRTDSFLAPAVALANEPDDIGAQLVEVTRLVSTNTAAQENAALPEETFEPPPDTSSTSSEASAVDGGPDDGGPDAFLAGGFVIALLACIVVLAARRRGRAARRAVTRTPGPAFRLPAGVVGRVRSAEARRTARQAESEVLALGEDVDAADMDARADQAWQQVLDHYSAARSLLDALSHPADVVGALVLARRGQLALDAARRHATFTADVPCYFNPLHPPGSHQVGIGAGDARVEVPACPGCRGDLQEGRDPDVLEVSVARGAVPYYESGREPWASTGFGALDTDLVGRLTEYRAGRGA